MANRPLISTLLVAVAVTARMGEPRHTRVGTWCFGSMLLVGVSAALLAVRKPAALSGGPRARRQPSA